MKKFLALVAGVLGLGIIAKLATRKAEAAVTPGTLPATPVKPKVESIPILPPPEPAGGWQAHMTTTATQQAIADCRNANIASTEDELRLCVMIAIFPNLHWGTRVGWQVNAWNEAGKQVAIAAEIGSWPFIGADARYREIAVTFWLIASRVVRECKKTNVTLEQIQTCAAKAMFPQETWPPPTDAGSFLKAVWDRLTTVIAQQAS